MRSQWHRSLTIETEFGRIRIAFQFDHAIGKNIGRRKGASWKDRIDTIQTSVIVETDEIDADFEQEEHADGDIIPAFLAFHRRTSEICVHEE